MQIPRSYVENYSKALNVVSDKARIALVDALSQIDYSADVASIREAVIAIMQPACGASSTMAARLAADFYDGLRARFGIDDGFMAEVDAQREPEATEGAVRAFAQDLVDGKPVEQFVGKCADRIDYETRRAANECIAYNAKNDPKKPRWARIPTGAETCQFCIMLASRGFVYHSEETASHAHANCVVAETGVAGIGLLAGMRREYKGTLVNIRTRGGRNLTVTPNHPILTTRGWVVAGEIKEFDNLICANFIHGDNGSVPDINDVPPTAKEVFESCSFMDSTLFDSVPVAAENLNGEIIGDSNIKVINPLGFLKRAIETTINEPIEHGGFSVAQNESSVSCPLLDAFGAFNLFGFRNNSTSNSIMGGCGLCSSFFGGHSRSANDSSFGLVARSDSSFREPPIDNLTADVETVGDGINALTVIERFENAIGHWDSLAACLNAIAFEYTKNGCFTTSDFVDNLLSSSTRLIEIDDVESVSFSERSCHVYNLSTKGGWYVSSGIITHNCDCRVVPSWDKSPLAHGYDPDKYYDMWKHPEKYASDEENKKDKSQGISFNLEGVVKSSNTERTINRLKSLYESPLIAVQPMLPGQHYATHASTDVYTGLVISLRKGDDITVAHEYAHSMWNSKRLKEYQIEGHEQFGKEIRKLYRKYKNDDSLEALISMYSLENVDEFLAEAFAAYVTGQNPDRTGNGIRSPYVKLVGELVDKYFKKR